MPVERETLHGFTLRAVRDERDVARYVAFNATYNGASEGAICDRLLRHHPEARYDDYLLVEDERTGEVVSTTCLIPWHCRYEQVALEVAMLEMVLTHPQYRHHGLVRAQVRRFHQVAQERGFDLTIIQGIPYYYRQFGYAYALDAWASDSLPAWHIPDGPADGYRLRPATADDAPLLADLYERTQARLQLCVVRGVEHWRYLLTWAPFPVRLVEDATTGRPVGYIHAVPIAGRQGMRVGESAIAGADLALAVLRALKLEAGGEIQLAWPQEGTLVQLGRSFGAVPLPAYQWLLRLTDVGAFLAKIGPALERRLAASDCAGLSTDLTINLFHRAYRLRFREGELAGVDGLGFVDASMGADGGDLCIPPEAFVRLTLGYRSLGDLRDAWPDIVVRPERRHLLAVLFPKMTSYLCVAY